MLCACLMMSAACSKEVQIVRLGPPETLTAEVVIPEWEGRTNGDLLRWAIKLRRCADKANIQLKAIREWAANGKHEGI
jgi:hypothetical protein